MFHILSTLALELLVFSQFMHELQGESPNVQLYSEPWGHVDHSDDNCGCLSSDRMDSYVHGLSLMPRSDVPIPGSDDASVHTEESGARMDLAYCLGVGRPGSVPFVSLRPGAYGRLLLAVYVRWKTALVLLCILLCRWWVLSVSLVRVFLRFTSLRWVLPLGVN